MKKVLLLLTIPMLFLAASCDKSSTSGISGEQAAIGEVGTTITCDFGGVSNMDISVKSLDKGISTLGGSFTFTDERYRKLVENHPKYCTVDGNKVEIHDIKYKATDKGIQIVSGPCKGTLVKYNSKKGDKYENGGKVTHVSSDNDFNWRGMNIKVIQVERKNKGDGIKSVTYWANHRFGLVAIETTFDDGSTDYGNIRLN